MNLVVRLAIIPIFLYLECLHSACGATIPSDAIAGWNEMESKLSIFQIELEEKSSIAKKGDRSYFAVQGDLLKSEKQDENGDVHIADIRDKFGFRLQNQHKNWQVSKIVQPDESFHLDLAARLLASQGFSFWVYFKLKEIPNRRDIDVVRWEQDPIDADLVNFWIDWKGDDRKFDRGKLVLQKSKRFRVQSLEMIVEGMEDDPSVIEYVYNDNTMLEGIMPASWRHTYDRAYCAANPQKSHYNLGSIHLIGDKRLPETEFTLAHYGLPDYVPPTNHRPWLWLSVVGAILAASYLWVQRKGKLR